MVIKLDLRSRPNNRSGNLYQIYQLQSFVYCTVDRCIYWRPEQKTIDRRYTHIMYYGLWAWVGLIYIYQTLLKPVEELILQSVQESSVSLFSFSMQKIYIWAAFDLHKSSICCLFFIKKIIIHIIDTSFYLVSFTFCWFSFLKKEIKRDPNNVRVFLIWMGHFICDDFEYFESGFRTGFAFAALSR